MERYPQLRTFVFMTSNKMSFCYLSHMMDFRLIQKDVRTKSNFLALPSNRDHTLDQAGVKTQQEVFNSLPVVP